MTMNNFDKVAKQFTDLVIEKMKSISSDWRKPWFVGAKNGNAFVPQNLNGRNYCGGNAILLLFLCEKYSFQTPVFLTFNQARQEGIAVLKGSKSFPIYYTFFLVFDRETNEKISLEEYKKLSEEEQEKYKVIFFTDEGQEEAEEPERGAA